jgi:hypothetical protein
MSGGALYRRALGLVCSLELPAEARADVTAVMKACRHEAFLQLLYEAGSDAHLRRDLLLLRGAAVFLKFCAVQLADDLADDECGYLERPGAQGSTAQFLLQNLFYSTALEANVGADALREAALDLVHTAAAQHVEVHTRDWNVERAKFTAAGLNGRQYTAYLRILWAGCELAPKAAHIGWNLGVSAQIAGDARSIDRRFASLSMDGKHEIAAWALACVRSLGDHDLGMLRLVVPGIEAELLGWVA